jgi:hypothetical protein
MSRPVEAKYCPRCGAMNARRAETCIHCRRRFQSEQSALSSTDLAAPLSEEDLHRTQMFMLPPVTRIELPNAWSDSDTGRSQLSGLRELLTSTGRSPILLAAIILFLAAAAALFGLIAALGVLHH